MKKEEKIQTSLVGLWLGTTTMAIPLLAPLVTDTVLPAPLSIGFAVGGGAAVVASWGSLQKIQQDEETDPEI